MLRYIGKKLIRGYQKTLSPDHGWLKGLYPNGFCRYHPTCSQYAHDSIDKNGFCLGSIMGMWRVLRCNPWSSGGYDPAKKIKIKIKK